MQRFPRFLAVIAVAVATLASVARAQLVTFETISAFTGSIQTFQTNRAFTQTFSNVTQVESMTYRFVASGGSSSATSLNYYFTEWNTSTNMAVGSAIQSGSVSITASNTGSWANYLDADSNTYRGLDHTFTLSAAVDHTKTYAMVLVGTTSGSNVGLQNVDTGNNFLFGQNFRTDGISSFGLLTSTAPTTQYNSDWGFSQIVVAPYIAPVPEASTIAIAFAAVFIAFLVALRLRQRRLALAAVPAASLAQ